MGDKAISDLQFTDIKKALRVQDEEELNRIIPRFAEENPESTDRILQQMMFIASAERRDEHKPFGLLFLDSVRDLSTLYEETNDLLSLYRNAIHHFCYLDLQDWDSSLTTLKPEDMGESVLVGDLEEYIRAGEVEKAVHEAVKLLMMMDNEFYLVEILTEIAASTNQDDGFSLMLAGAVLKSVEFVRRSQFKNLVYQLTGYLASLDLGWEEKHLSDEYGEEVVFPQYYQNAFGAGEAGMEQVVYLTYAQQVWEGARMKADSTRRYIGRFISENMEPKASQNRTFQVKPKHGTLENITSALQLQDYEESKALILGYVKSGGGLGTLYKKMTDLFLGTYSTEDTNRVILFNAYRTAVAYLNPPEQYEALLKAAEMICDIH